jgi:hypothetical protein
LKIYKSEAIYYQTIIKVKLYLALFQYIVTFVEDLILKAMKKLFFALALTFLTVAGFAAEMRPADDSEKVAYVALRSFEQEFKDAEEISWRVGDDYAKAYFTSLGKKMVAFYTHQGDYIGAVQYLDYKQLPLKTRQEIEKKFKDYQFSEAIQIVGRPSSDYDDIGTYYVDLTNDSKEIYLRVSSSDITVHKTVERSQTAQK